MNTNTEYAITDNESEKTLLRTHDFQKIWNLLEQMGADRGRMSVSATIDDPDDEADGNSTFRNGQEVWEDGEEAFT